MGGIHLSAMEITHRRSDGQILWRATVPNRMFHQGIELLLNWAYRGQDAFPYAWFGRLFAGAPDDDDTIADLVGEPSGDGYTYVTWDRADYDWGPVELVGDALQTRGAEKVFGPATADWPVVTTIVLATAHDASALLWARYPLAEPRVVRLDETLAVRPIGMIRGANF